MTWHQLFLDYERYVTTPAGPERTPLLNSVYRATAEFLSKTEHKRKFHHAEFVKVLHESAKSAQSFSAQDAEDSFRAMERIARNLYLQPWRVDQFRSIKKWNHLYKCRIEPCLIGAERIFKLIGYDETAEELRLNADIMAGRPWKKLLEVAFDCFVISLECRLMGTVRSLVENGGQLPWAKILKARETVVGDVQRCAAQIDPKSIDYSSSKVPHSVDGSSRKESLLLPELQAPPSWVDLSSQQIDSMQDPWSLVPSSTSSLWASENGRTGASVQAGTMISVPVQGGLRRTNFTTTPEATGPPPIPAHHLNIRSSSPYDSNRNRGEIHSPSSEFERSVPIREVHSSAPVPPEHHERHHHSSHSRTTQPPGVSNERIVPLQVDPFYYTKRQSSYHPQPTAVASSESLISEMNDRMSKMTTDLRTARKKAQTIARADGNVECPHCQMFISPATIICPHCSRLVGDFIHS
uniref:Spermatogenesis-associated protein 2 PUB-like domain-containing protein n=1 Tax=Plectus sambesii TaxID=2011161 RepID=A0A914XHB8_9BILA